VAAPLDPADQRDFFISHAAADKLWADWIGQQLDDGGYSVELDIWNWSPGDDFVSAMENALRRACRVIAVYTSSYFARPFAQAEHRSAFASTVAGHRGRIVPVLVERCVVPELYSTLIRIELVDLDQASARRRLLDGVAGAPGPPGYRVTFPSA